MKNMYILTQIIFCYWNFLGYQNKPQEAPWHWLFTKICLSYFTNRFQMLTFGPQPKKYLQTCWFFYQPGDRTKCISSAVLCSNKDRILNVVGHSGISKNHCCGSQMNGNLTMFCFLLTPKQKVWGGIFGL